MSYSLPYHSVHKLTLKMQMSAIIILESIFFYFFIRTFNLSMNKLFIDFHNNCRFADWKRVVHLDNHLLKYIIIVTMSVTIFICHSFFSIFIHLSCACLYYHE